MPQKQRKFSFLLAAEAEARLNNISKESTQVQ